MWKMLNQPNIYCYKRIKPHNKKTRESAGDLDPDTLVNLGCMCGFGGMIKLCPHVVIKPSGTEILSCLYLHSFKGLHE